jgi:hypothetical protein
MRKIDVSCSPLVVGGTQEDLGVELSASVSGIHHLNIFKIKNQKTNNFKQNNTSSTNNFQRKRKNYSCKHYNCINKRRTNANYNTVGSQ